MNTGVKDWPTYKQLFHEARSAYLENIHITEDDIFITRRNGYKQEFFMMDNPKGYNKLPIYLPAHLVDVVKSKNHLIHSVGLDHVMYT